VPKAEDINTAGLNITKAAMKQLLSIDSEEWLHDMDDLNKFYKQFGKTLPKEIKEEYASLRKRLQKHE
jgi:phosphoenolpyruvate carboxykinase (GTP)